MGLCLLLTRTAPGLAVTFLDVGQGDCALLRCRGAAIMIDCGSTTKEQVWKYNVSPCLKYYGVRRLDGFFVSHGDADHINGLLELLASYSRDLAGSNIGDVSLESVWIAAGAPQEDQGLTQVWDSAAGAKVPVCRIACFDEVDTGALRLTCLHPMEGEGTTDPNQNSMVLLSQYGKTRLLFTGDLELEGEEAFLTRYAQWMEEESARENNAAGSGFTILKVGHHGSKNATREGLLALLHPDLAVISCGKVKS